MRALDLAFHHLFFLSMCLWAGKKQVFLMEGAPRIVILMVCLLDFIPENVKTLCQGAVCKHPSPVAVLRFARCSFSNTHSENSFPTLSTYRHFSPKAHFLPKANLWAHSSGNTSPTAWFLNLEERHVCVCMFICTCFTRALREVLGTPNLLEVLPAR